MILRNPSLLRDFFFLPCWIFLFYCTSDIAAQGIHGRVIESDANRPVPNAQINILQKDSILATLYADSAGMFSYKTNDAVRIRLHIQSLGFDPLVSEEIVLDGYTTHRFTYAMRQQAYTLEGVVVTSTQPALPYLRRISKDDLLTVAGNYDDPFRVAHTEPGMIMINDQANHLSVRGQQPVFNSWYLEGLEIVNPSHTNNAGTLSDLPSQSGGGINMFSAQTLGNTEVYTGVSPLKIGRAAGAAFNMQLHESAEPEFRAKAGFLGFELGGGARVGEKAIVDLNLRYSFTGLLADLGVDFGGEKIGFYDGVVSFRHSGDRHKLKIFSWAGTSKNEFNKLSREEEKESYKDFFDIDYNNDILGAGFTYDQVLGNKTSLHLGSAYSRLQTGYRREGQFGANPVNFNLDEELFILTSTAQFSIHFSPKFQSSLGIDYTDRNHSEIRPILENENFLRPYITAEIQITPALRLEAGGEIKKRLNKYYLNGIRDFGYRGLLTWEFLDKHSLFAGARRSPGQSVRVFGGKEPWALQLIIEKLEGGWFFTGEKNAIELKLYQERVNNMTLYEMVNGIVHLADFAEPIDGIFLDGYFNAGDAKYYGVEGKWSYTDYAGFRFTFNQSLFRSMRQVADEGYNPGRFDNRFATHATVSKEIIRHRNGKNRIWNFSLRGLYHGGLLEPEIEVIASSELEGTVYVDNYAFVNRLPDYKRIDAGIYRTIANPNVRWRFALDIQNLLGFRNVAFHYYDPFLGEVVAQEQLGIIPVFSVQASW